MSRRLLVASLATVFALAGCSAHPLAAPSRLSAAPATNVATPSVTSRAVTAPTVNVLQGQAPAAPAAPLAPSQGLPLASAPVVAGIHVLGHAALNDEELADDAESLGFSLLSAPDNSGIQHPYSKTGIVRRTADGFALQPSNSLFKAKDKHTYILTGSAEILDQLSKRENKKALIKGTVDKDDLVTVSSVKGLADMGFLTNWLSKGKISGIVKNSASQVPLADVKVEVQSGDGFVFSALSDADGEFEIKSLTPGTYTVTMSKTGFTTETLGGEEVKKRTNVKVVGGLPPVAAD